MRSARSIASTAEIGAAALVGSMLMRRIEDERPTSLWPRVGPSSVLASSTTPSQLAGTIVPVTPMSDATSRTDSSRSPVASKSPTSSRLPTVCPLNSPLLKRCSKDLVSGLSGSPSAPRHLRRSPTAATSRSARSRPDEPPSSATETTPVTSLESRRRARNDTAVPWPPPTATTFIEQCRGERRRW